MDLIKPTCRESLSEVDRSFIRDALGATDRDRVAVSDLMNDPASLDMLLDEEILLHALLQSPDTLRVSLHFYLYVLIRRLLLRRGLDNRELTDYLASMLACFNRTARLSDFRDGSDQVIECMADLETAAQSFGEPGAFYIRVYIGNFSLFLTGMFPERIRRRRHRRGAPGLPYYTGVGRSNYQMAGGHRLAEREGLSGIYHTLASEYVLIQTTLHQLCEQFLFLNDVVPTGVKLN